MESFVEVLSVIGALFSHLIAPVAVTLAAVKYLVKK